MDYLTQALDEYRAAQSNLLKARSVRKSNALKVLASDCRTLLASAMVSAHGQAWVLTLPATPRTLPGCCQWQPGDAIPHTDGVWMLPYWDQALIGLAYHSRDWAKIDKAAHAESQRVLLNRLTVIGTICLS